MNVASVALDGGDAALGMRNITVGEPLSNRVVFCPATVGTACDLDLSSGSCYKMLLLLGLGGTRFWPQASGKGRRSIEEDSNLKSC